MHRVLCAVWLAFVVAGCGDDGVVVDATTDNFCAEVARVVCNNMYQCCTEAEIETRLGVDEPRSEAQCQVDIQRRCERNTAVVQHSLAQQRVHFDSNNLNGCLQSLVAPSDTCAEVLDAVPWEETCLEPAFVGVVAVDGECTEDYECANSPDAECVNNRCRARPGHGQPCGIGCSSTTYCSQGLCQPRLPEGGTCTSTSQCEEELYCDLSAMMPTCKQPAAAGAACLTDSGCESGNCLPGTCAGTTQECFEDTDCQGRCADDNSPCSSDASCGAGTCQMSGQSCFSPTGCTLISGDTCIFPISCVPDECVGDPVCAVAEFEIDYCTLQVETRVGI